MLDKIKLPMISVMKYPNFLALLIKTDVLIEHLTNFINVVIKFNHSKLFLKIRAYTVKHRLYEHNSLQLCKY